MGAVTIFLLLAFGAAAQEVTDSCKVYGNCGMCRQRIEKAAKQAGATTAAWDKTTGILTVSFPSGKRSLDAIQKKVAEVGHDTDAYTAKDKVYNKLPMCCLYERKGKPGSGKAMPH